MARKKIENINFEKSLAELTTIVESMEQGNLPLEQALTQFEKGITLIRDCNQALTSAEQKVLMLTKQGKLSDFQAE